MTDLTPLITRLEKATSTDREIDALLWNLIDDRPLEEVGDQLGKRDPDDGCAFDIAPDYTASLDAALALVERLLPGWTWMVAGGAPPITAEVYPLDRTMKEWGANAPSAPLALLLALLRSLQAQGGEQ